MSPPTTTTAPALKAALVEGLRAWPALDGIQVERRFPGPNTAPEGIYLGNIQGASEIPNIRPGRQQRQERYRVTIIVQTWQALDADTPEGAQAAEDRAYELFGHVDEFLAENVSLLGFANVAELAEWQETTEPFQGGWCSQIAMTVDVSARLT